MLLWGLLVVSSVDNILKPLLISRGSDLPFVLVLLGVLGGAVAFGFIGVFLGPVLIAVGFALLKEWAGQLAAAGSGGSVRGSARIIAAGRRRRVSASASAADSRPSAATIGAQRGSGSAGHRGARGSGISRTDASFRSA